MWTDLATLLLRYQLPIASGLATLLVYAANQVAFFRGLGDWTKRAATALAAGLVLLGVRALGGEPAAGLVDLVTTLIGGGAVAATPIAVAFRLGRLPSSSVGDSIHVPSVDRRPVADRGAGRAVSLARVPRSMILAVVLLLTFATSLAAQCPTVDVVLTGGERYVLVVDGDTVSTRASRDKLITDGAAAVLQRPAATVRGYSVQEFRFTGHPCPVVVVPDTTTPPVPIDTVVTPPPPPPPPPPTGGTNLPPHPRVWMNAKRIARLRDQVAASTVRWTRVRKWADAQVARGTEYAAADASYLSSLCAAYLGTANPAYAQRADVILQHRAVADYDLRDDSGYPYRSGLPAITIGLDWCYDGLSPATRHQVASWLMDRADWVWPETNPVIDGNANKRYALDRATNNYWWGYMMTGPAALAAAGDDTVSTRDRAAEHIALALAKWAGPGSAALTEQAGGMWGEGTGYDSSNRVGLFVDAFNTSGLPLDHPFLRESLLWRIHSTMPGGRLKVPLGDQARVSNAPLFQYDRQMALDVLPTVGDAALAGQVYSWLDWIGQVPQSSGGLSAVAVDELVRFDPDAPRLPIAELPRAYVAPGTGVMVYRRSWTDSAGTAFVFSAGRQDESHSDRADNQLLIWHGGDWATVSANLYSHSGIRHETIYHNTVTVSGQQQVGRGGVPRLISESVTDSLVVVSGTADSVYVQYDGTNPVSQYQRQVAYLPDHDAFVVVDRVVPTLDTATVVVRWHTRTRPTVVGSTFGLGSCRGTAHGATVGLAPMQLGQKLGTDTTSWAVTLTAPGAATIVTVVECGPASPAPVVEDQADAVRVRLGATTLVLPSDGTRPIVRDG